MGLHISLILNCLIEIVEVGEVGLRKTREALFNVFRLGRLVGLNGLVSHPQGFNIRKGQRSGLCLDFERLHVGRHCLHGRRKSTGLGQARIPLWRTGLLTAGRREGKGREGKG